MDGTLVNSNDNVMKSWYRLAQSAGLETEAIHRIHGMPARSFIPMLLGPDRQDEAEHWISWHLEQECNDLEGVVPVQGAKLLLSYLDDHQIPWTIVTSCERPLAIARLKHSNMSVPETLVSVNDVTQGKPNPEPFVLGATRLNVEPSESIAVEDAVSGITAAKAAGCYTIGVVSTHEKSQLDHADYVAEDLAEVLSKVKELLS
ncbi:MAG: hypothetical protein RIS09_1090 [Actinomycetota bacterium]